MNYQLELQLLGLLGLVIHYLKNWQEYNLQGKRYEVKKSIPTIILSAVTTGVLIYLRDSIQDLYVVTPFSALVIGYFGNSLFFSFISAKAPKPKDEVEKPYDKQDGSKPPEEERPDKP